ncbi:unnamed protein product [Symbiodinium sp. CCMP2456]|nr:unnamed protein product [Symbiodinium sp. CCMP2456]
MQLVCCSCQAVTGCLQRAKRAGPDLRFPAGHPPRSPKQSSAAWSPSWKAKVQELSLRGMTLRSLLAFYQEDLQANLDFQYAPKDHKTRDVVRRVIIPITSAEECSYAVSCHNRDGPRRAHVMVTHNWGNCFKDLLAAVVSDALQECSFQVATKLLEEDVALLYEMLKESCRLDDTYWICAFAVNRHMCICRSNPYDRDPLTNVLHPVCTCHSLNISDADGQSVASETMSSNLLISDSDINKFVHMVYHLASTGGCRQVTAVELSFDLFNRAWCVAEIAEAKRLQMRQSLQLASKRP